MIESVVAAGEAQRHPWLIYTAGAMGAGKSRTIGWMSEQGYFPLSQIVHLDPDMFKTHFPEWQGYLSTAMSEAGSRTRRESGYLVEIAQQAAMAARKHVWVDGSLRDGEWYASELQRLREAHPGYRRDRLRQSGRRRRARARAPPRRDDGPRGAEAECVTRSRACRRASRCSARSSISSR